MSKFWLPSMLVAMSMCSDSAQIDLAPDDEARQGTSGAVDIIVDDDNSEGSEKFYLNSAEFEESKKNLVIAHTTWKVTLFHWPIRQQCEALIELPDGAAAMLDGIDLRICESNDAAGLITIDEVTAMTRDAMKQQKIDWADSILDPGDGSGLTISMAGGIVLTVPANGPAVPENGGPCEVLMGSSSYSETIPAWLRIPDMSWQPVQDLPNGIYVGIVRVENGRVANCPEK